MARPDRERGDGPASRQHRATTAEEPPPPQPGLVVFRVAAARLIAALHRRASRQVRDGEPGGPLHYTDAEITDGWAGDRAGALEWLHRRAAGEDTR